MTTKLELFGETDDYNKLKKKINTNFINLRIDDNKFQRFLFKENFILLNIIHLVISIASIVYFLLALHLHFDTKIIIIQGIGSFLLGTLAILFFKFLKTNIQQKNLRIQNYLKHLRILFSISVYLILMLNFYFCISKDNFYTTIPAQEANTTGMNSSFLETVSTIEEYSNNYIKKNINLYLVIILFIKFFCFVFLFCRMKILIIIISVAELVFLFTINYINDNYFIIEILFDIISNLVSFFIVYLIENLNKFYFFYRQSFKKTYCEFIEKFHNLGIKNFLFNGENIIDLNKTFDRYNYFSKKSTLNINNNRNLIEEFKMINNSSGSNNNNNINSKLNHPSNEDYNDSSEENKFLNFLMWLPSYNESLNDTSYKREFLNKLIEYDQEGSLEEIKKEIYYEEILNYELNNKNNKSNENESPNLKVLRNNTIQNSSLKKPAIFKKHTLLELLELLKYEFEIDKNNEKLLDIEFNNIRWNKRFNGYFDDNHNNKNNDNNLCMQNGLNDLIDKKYGEVNNNHSVQNNNNNGVDHNGRQNNNLMHCHTNQDNSSCVFNNNQNYLNNSTHIELLNGFSRNFSNKNIHKLNPTYSNDNLTADFPNKKVKGLGRIDRSLTFTNVKKSQLGKHINDSFKSQKENSPCFNPQLNINCSSLLFNGNNQNLNFNFNLNNTEKNFRNKIKNLKIQSDFSNSFVFVGKYISKESLKEEELNYDHIAQLQYLYFRTVYKVFFKKIIYKRKIFFELLIIEDVEYSKSSTNIIASNNIDKACNINRAINNNINININNNKNRNLNVANNSHSIGSINNSNIASMIKPENISLKEFGKIAHELKTPLNAIIGLINDLMHKSMQKTIQPNLTSINSLANYLIFLISDLTQYCNNFCVEDIQIFVDKINLYDILDFCLEILKSLLICKNRENSIKTILNFRDDINLLTIKSDEIRLKQILLNFISNAVKFTKSGEIRIHTKIKSEISSVKVSIKDTGVGMKEEVLKKLFSENERIKEESVLNRFGSGFGLSIAKSLSEKLNIAFKFKSKYQVGSTFSIYIPFEKSPTIEKYFTLNSTSKENTPTINIIKSTHTQKSISNDNSTRKTSNNILLFNNTSACDKTESSSNLHCYNVITDRLTERKSTKNMSFRCPSVNIQIKGIINNSLNYHAAKNNVNNNTPYVYSNFNTQNKLKCVNTLSGNLFNTNNINSANTSNYCINPNNNSNNIYGFSSNRSSQKMILLKTGIDRKGLILEGFNDSCNLLKFLF